MCITDASTSIIVEKWLLEMHHQAWCQVPNVGCVSFWFEGIFGVFRIDSMVVSGFGDNLCRLFACGSTFSSVKSEFPILLSALELTQGL